MFSSRALAAQRRMREEAEAPHAVIHGNEDHALLGEPDARRVGRRARAAREPAAVDPDHHGQIAGGRIGRTPDVQVETVLRRSLNGGRTGGRCGRGLSRRGTGHGTGAGAVPGAGGPPTRAPAPGGGPKPRPCMQLAPNSVAWRTSVHFAAGCGGRHRSSPTGGAAKGIPLKERTPSAATPCSSPVSTRRVAGAGDCAAGVTPTAATNPASEYNRTLVTLEAVLSLLLPSTRIATPCSPGVASGRGHRTRRANPLFAETCDLNG